MPCPCRDPAVLGPCRFESDFSRPRHSTAWHVWINIGLLSTACGRHAQVRLLSATTPAFTEVVNQNVTAFWGAFNLFWLWWRQQIMQNYTFLWTNLKARASISSVVMIRLHHVLFWLSVCNNCFKFSNFEIFILRYLKKFCSSSFRLSESEILLRLLLLETIFSFFSLFFWKKIKPTGNYHILLPTMVAGIA